MPVLPDTKASALASGAFAILYPFFRKSNNPPPTDETIFPATGANPAVPISAVNLTGKLPGAVSSAPKAPAAAAVAIKPSIPIKAAGFSRALAKPASIPSAIAVGTLAFKGPFVGSIRTLSCNLSRRLVGSPFCLARVCSLIFMALLNSFCPRLFMRLSSMTFGSNLPDATPLKFSKNFKP